MEGKGKGKGRVGIFLYYRERRQRRGKTGLGRGDYGEGRWPTNETRSGGERAVELEEIKRRVKEQGERRGKERGPVLIQTNRNNYGDARRIRNDFYRATLFPSPLEEISVIKSHSISRSFTTIFANNYCMEGHKAAFECLLRFPQNPIPCRLFQIPLSPTIIPR